MPPAIKSKPQIMPILSPSHRHTYIRAIVVYSITSHNINKINRKSEP